MSELSHHDDSNMNFKENEHDESKLQQQNYNIIQPKRNVPIKTQIKQLEKELSDLRAGLNENKKAGMLLKGELIGLEGVVKEKCNELSKAIIDDLVNFDKDLKRVIKEDRTSTDFFKVQLNSLNDDKIKLQKETISLASRMRTCEVEIGVDPK
jgi:hypothetical protein